MGGLGVSGVWEVRVCESRVWEGSGDQGIGDVGLLFLLIVYQMEFEKTRWSCLWNSDQNCTQNSTRGGGVGAVGIKG